ncbi:hypothetical protein LGH82_10610 [Mesorhizobium sp. PAMC28654]|uniref:hypothetical protein n=1 Tax=Mesorhizobium sp. PAMC28654 TaxID=2880934 RepID=UPI001D0BE123|nr:hypothetical protein [Mesorhizobium sp. PAMC28654]UDL91641.1 hypothetical protein LGH82_10610 [Mesorhizobium sp. PAMC28654]
MTAISVKRVGIFTLVTVLFAVAFLGIIVSQKGAPPPPKRLAVVRPFEGKLNIQSIDDLRVGGRKILLCGAAFTKPQALRQLITQAARRDYQGLGVACKPVGAGTPCDGKVASRFGDAFVVQCLMPDGADLAARLTQGGMLCGQPAQAGDAYKPC